MVLLDHIWQELLYEPKVGKNVDIVGEPDIILGCIQNGLPSADACIIDNYGRLADRLSNGLCRSLYGLRGA